jgi:hypothetical protein
MLSYRTTWGALIVWQPFLIILISPLCYIIRARICSEPFKEPRIRFPAWRAGTTTLFSYRPVNRFLGSLNVCKYPGIQVTAAPSPWAGLRNSSQPLPGSRPTSAPSCGSGAATPTTTPTSGGSSSPSRSPPVPLLLIQSSSRYGVHHDLLKAIYFCF